MASSETRLSRDEWKKKNELDELRKSGALEPEKDADGNEINPHIPQYMSAAPWYLNTGLGLKHQKNYKDKTVAEGVAARSVAAIGKSKKVSGSRDEFGEKIGQSNAKTEMPRANGYDASYAGKRDRWNGYDPSSYLRVMKKHELLAKERQAIREANVDASLVEGGTKTDKKAKKKKDDDSSSSSDEEEEQEMDADKAEMLDRDGAVIGQQIDEGRVGMKTRVSVRNLRIREDTAKYLRNLDTSSAYYDPKTRSMRSNPNPEKDPNEVDFAGDNFIRYTGEAKSLASQQLYEFEAYERGQQVHMLAMPTQAENLHKTFEEKKNSLASKQKEDLMEKYGGREYTENKLPAALKYGQTEQYVEYSEDGRVIKGEEGIAKMSKYEEEKLVNNHTRIWGSFWHNGRWGYACCCQHLRNSYCTGATGVAAFEKQQGSRIGNSPLYENSSQMMAAMQQKVEKAATQQNDEAKKMAKMGERNEGKSLADFDKKALKKALKEEEKRQRGDTEDDKKRKYNSLGTSEVTEEEMEAYFLKKRRDEDPFAGSAGTKGYDFV